MSRVGVESALDALQLRGANVLVHTKLSAMGLASEDASWLCEAVLTHVGHSGTVVMPSFTTSRTLFDPENPALAFHPDLPVDGEIGVVAETFRRRPAVLRSNHPTHSFASVGPQSRLILSTQRDNNPLGPIKKLNVMQGHVVLLGTPLKECTAIHLAEEMAPYPYLGRATALRINAAGYEERVVVEHLPGCGEAFARLETRFDPSDVLTVDLGSVVVRKIPVRYLVRLATAGLAADPAFFVCENVTCESCARKRAAIDAKAARTPPRP